MFEEELHSLAEALRRMTAGAPPHLPSPVSAEAAPAFQALESLYTMHREIESFARALADGDLDAKLPSSRTSVSGALKQLHAQLKHLTWQAQCVARGDYNQRIDFMGDFAESFNEMIAQLHMREAQLTAQRDVMMHIFDSVDPIIILDPSAERSVLYANRMARAHFGLTGEQCRLETLSPVLRKIFEVLPHDGSVDVLDEQADRWYNVSVSELPWTSKQFTLLYHCTDITTHKGRELLLARHAHTDPLTGLMNRRGFDETAEQAWAACLRARAPLSILMLDIDFFKKCNDAYGHPQGDLCLTEFGRLLSRSFGRPNDIVARYGGEEFIAVLPHTKRESAMLVAEKVRSATSAMEIALLDHPETMIHITVSCGLSCIVPDDSSTLEQQIAAADRALYAAKQGGRNRVVCLDPPVS